MEEFLLEHIGKKLNPKYIVIIAVMFVSFSSIFIKMCTAPSLVIATYRLFFTVLLILPSTFIKNRKELKKARKKHIILCIISGVFLAFHFVTWIASIKYTSVSSAAVLVNIHPVIIALGSYVIFKDKVSKKAILCIIITLAGSFIISFGDSTVGSNIVFGDMLAIIGAVFVAFYMLIGRFIRQYMSVAVYTFIVYTSCMAALLILDLFTKTVMYPYPIKDWLLFFMLAFFCTILGHSVFSWSLKYVKPAFVSVSNLGEPVFASIWAVILFKELPQIWNFIGSIIIIYGIYRYTKIVDN